MATYLLSGANGAAPGAWPEELLVSRPEIEGSGGFHNLSMAAAGPVSALAQVALALARAAKAGDLFIWDHADAILGAVKDAGYDPIEAMRPVELFLRSCARRKIMVAPLLSERLGEAGSLELEEMTLRLMHLFERFSIPALSMTAELRAALKAQELRAAHFGPDGAIYKPARPVRSHLAAAVGRHTKAIELARRAPQQRTDPIYPEMNGVLRVALPSNAAALGSAEAGALTIGPVTTEIITIAPGGRAVFEVEGELLGLAVILGPEEGVMTISIDSDGFDDLRCMPISLWRAGDGPALGQVAPAALLKRRALLPFPTRMMVHNVSADPGEAVIRADHGASPPPELNRAAPVRLMAVIERRPHQHAPPEPAKKP